MKYFVVNKKMDYDRGFLWNAVYGEEGLALEPGKDYGLFFSRIFDCREEETVWHRFVTRGSYPGSASLSYTFYASDSPELLGKKGRRLISDLLADESLSPGAKKEILRPLEQKKATASEDILLQEVKGRYFFFLAELYRQGGESPRISQMVVYFPKEDWLRYLPGVYGRDKEGASFTSRFLGVFQSFYDDCDRKIRESSRLLEPLDMDYEGLKKLAQWFSVEDLHIWPEEKLRLLMKGLPGLVKKAGTVGGMLDFIRLYTGEEPMLVECQPAENHFRTETFEKPYGQNPYEFVLLIKEKYLSTAREYEAMMCLIRQMKPAYMEVRLIPLRSRLTLGTYSYLGINSEIGSYSPLRLDGRGSLIFSAVGGKNTEGGAEI